MRDELAPMTCTYCDAPLHYKVGEKVQLSPDAHNPICDVCLAKLNAPPPSTDCFYCGDDLDYAAGETVQTYHEERACKACMAALELASDPDEVPTAEHKTPGNVGAWDCEYCGQTIWLKENDELHKSEAGYTVCEKCERMVRHEHMAAMQASEENRGFCSRPGQDIESRLCNAARFVDRSMQNPAPYNLGTIVLMASLNYDVTVVSVQREYEAMLSLRSVAPKENRPISCEFGADVLGEGEVTVRWQYGCTNCGHIDQHTEVEGPGRVYMWNCSKCGELSRRLE